MDSEALSLKIWDRELLSRIGHDFPDLVFALTIFKYIF